MTASVPRGVWSWSGTASRLAVSRHRAPAGSDERVNETVTLRRCAQYRKAFRCAAVSYPAEVLGLDAAADWIRRHGVAVDVVDAGGLAATRSAGILMQRVVMHTRAIPRPATAGAGRFVVDSAHQVVELTGGAPQQQRRRVLIDLTTRADTDDLVAAVISGIGLDLIGVHRRLRRGEEGRVVVGAMIAAMREIARRHAVIPVRLSLGDIDAADWGCAPDDLAAIAAAVDDAVEDGCIASRFPSPAVAVAPSRAAMMPWG